MAPGYAATFDLASFDTLSPTTGCELMAALTEALAIVDQAYILNRRTPLLYQSGVRYELPKLNRNGTQTWRDTPNVLQSGKGSCHELTAWRLAERRLYDGAPVHAKCSAKFVQGRLVFHLQLIDDYGGVEDPSAILGMGDNPWVSF